MGDMNLCGFSYAFAETQQYMYAEHGSMHVLLATGPKNSLLTNGTSTIWKVTRKTESWAPWSALKV